MYNEKSLRTAASFWDEASNDIDYTSIYGSSKMCVTAAMDMMSNLATTDNNEYLLVIEETKSDDTRLDLEDDEDVQYLCQAMSRIVASSSADIYTTEVGHSFSQADDGREDEETRCPRTPRRLQSFGYAPADGFVFKTEKTPTSPTCVSMLKAATSGVTIPLPDTDDSPELIEATHGVRKWLRPRSSIGRQKHILSVPEPEQLRDDDETQSHMQEWSRRSSSSVAASVNNVADRIRGECSLREADDENEVYRHNASSNHTTRRQNVGSMRF